MAKQDQNLARNMNRGNYNTGQGLINSGIAGQDKTLAAQRGQLQAALSAGSQLIDPNSNYQKQARLTEASASNAENDAAAQGLQDATSRTGTNSAALAYNLKDINRQKARLIADQQSGRQQGDYQKYLGLQQWATGAYDPQISAYGNRMGVGSSLASGGAGNETSMANQPPWWQTLVNGGAAVGAAYAGKK